MTDEVKLPFSVYEPWEESVGLDDVLIDLAKLIGDHIYLTEDEVNAVALWVVMSWMHEHLDVAPFLNVTSATKRCGKTALLEILGSVCCRPLPVSGGFSSGALGRSIAVYRPTLIIDEVDTFLKRSTELRGALNGSQRRSGANILRCDGPNYFPVCIDTWCPKVLSGIGELPDTVLDRCIVIRMTRRPAAYQLKSFREFDDLELECLNRKLARLSLDCAHEVDALFSFVDFPKGLGDRAKDSWAPLLAIAKLSGPEWYAIATKACSVLNARDGEILSLAEELLIDIRKIFNETGASSLPTKVIVEKLVAMENRAWATCCNGGPITPYKLGRELKPFGIAPKTIRLGDRTLNGYSRSSFEFAWSRWLTPEIPHNPTP